MSDDTSSHLPVCVYCGTPRPADENPCPKCGKAWIDTSVAEAAAPAPVPPPPVETDDTDPMRVPVVPPPAALDDTGEFDFDDWTLPPEQPRSKARWIIPILLLIAVLAVWGFVFLDPSDTSTTTTQEAATTSTEAPTTTSADTTTTAADTTTTEAPTTTTTTIPWPSPGDWPPLGEPIPVDELTLKAAAIGPIDIGDGLGTVAGTLTSSLGEGDASGIDGLCGPEEGYWIQFGSLRAIFDGYEAGSVFVSYRHQDVGTGPEPALATLSGLELGDTVEDLQTIYAQYTISFELIDGKDHFRLSDGGELLLWGPVSSTESDGLIEGIFSPSPCDA